MIYFILVVFMTFIGSVASLFLKKASGSDSIIKLLANKNLYIGGILYVSSALINIYVLKFLDYSVVLPLTSITYIWTMFFSYIILKERITNKKILGVICIIIGAICVAL